MRTSFITVLLLFSCCLCRSAAIPYTALGPSQFATNGQMVYYRSDWTNELGVLRPATVNTEVTATNLNIYETLVLPAKVVLLTLGTNELNVATNSTWLLHSPTNDASLVTLSLAAGKFQGQLLFLTSQNGDGAFTLPDESEQYDVPGALVDLQGDWVGTTNRGVILQYTAPDWIEMARFNPASTNGPFPPSGGGDTILTNGITAGVIQPISTNDVAIQVGDPAALLEYGGSTSTNRSLLAAFYDEPTGATFTKYVGVGVISPGFAEYGEAFLIANGTGPGGGGGKLELISGNATTFWEAGMLSDSLADRMSLWMSIDGVYGVSLDPKIVSTGSAVAHFVDTFSGMTNGDSLFQVKNAGINRVRFQHDGTLSIQNTTNRLGVVAGVLQLDGYNIGGSSSVITYTNQFVYNGKVTFNQPVYVTNTTVYIDNVDVRTIFQGASASDETTALTVTTNAVRFQLPFAMTLTSVYASLTTPQASGSILTLDLKESGTSVLSTLLTIDNTEYGSDTATPAVISDSAIAKFAPLVFSITQVGTPPAGLKVWIGGIRLP